MDRGNGSTGRKEYKPGGSVTLYARLPAELKYLVVCLQNASKFPSFNYTIQHLLETHPDIARMAAELYTEAQRDARPGG